MVEEYTPEGYQRIIEALANIPERREWTCVRLVDLEEEREYYCWRNRGGRCLRKVEAKFAKGHVEDGEKEWSFRFHRQLLVELKMNKDAQEVQLEQKLEDADFDYNKSPPLYLTKQMIARSKQK